MDGLDVLRALTPSPPGWVIDWKAAESSPFGSVIADMKRTAQDPVYHGEGDVWTHTQMVCRALADMADYRALTRQERQLLFCAALLHDAGKPACTRQEGGRLVSPRHAAAGARLARRLLWLETGLCGTAEAQSFREMVCELIRWHTKPPHLAERPDAERQLRALGRRRQLALFHAYGASVRIVYLETTWDEQVRRNRDREAAVPEERILHMLDALDPPSPEEARQVQWLCL